MMSRACNDESRLPLIKSQPRLREFDWHEAIKFAGPLFKLAKSLALRTGYDPTHWLRYVTDKECLRILCEVEPWRLSTLEISGADYQYSLLARSLANTGSDPLAANRIPFKSYEPTSVPEFDIREQRLDRKFDLIIANQVFEHLLWPQCAARNVYSMLEPNGYFS